MSLIEIYQQLVLDHKIDADPSQERILPELNDILFKLNTQAKTFLFKKKQAIAGIYLYGTVGSGKTFLMDLFYEAAAIQEKARYHYHHFMQYVDSELRRLQGQKNPLDIIAANLAKTTQLLCLDEFMVHHIAEAMILGELLKALFERNTVLVITSNAHPDDLYPDGLQRTRFLPAIALLKSRLTVLSLSAARDFRFGHDTQFAAYLYPLSETNYIKMTEHFRRMEPNALSEGVITVQKRLIPYVKCGQEAIWFDFQVICNIPRSQLDYLELADKFQTLFISHVPKISEQSITPGLLFIQLVDVLYDRGIRLILCGAVPLDELYTAGEMLTAFQRTRSRLEEMQSMYYLKRKEREGL